MIKELSLNIILINNAIPQTNSFPDHSHLFLRFDQFDILINNRQGAADFRGQANAVISLRITVIAKIF